MAPKHALVIGLDYNGDLPGCLYDAQRVREHLEAQGYWVYSILGNQGTWRHITWAMYWVCLQCYLGNIQELFIHYSGHGTRVKDNNDDELDGHDEAIVCNDGYAIRDDTFFHYLSWIPHWVRVKILLDCCHSGTGMDLEYRFYAESNTAMRNFKGQLAADIQMISGCRDCQVAAEVTMNQQSQGALTSCYLSKVTQWEWGVKLVQQIHSKLITWGLSQRPVFSSSREIIV